jgi:hypothetical protein
VANPTAEVAAGVLQVFVEGAEPQRFPIEVRAHDQARFVLSTLVQGEWGAALVELNAGGAAVTHEVRGPGGWDIERCATQASGQWTFPWGQTAPQDSASLRLALFNPFPAEAVVDISFDTEDGFRAPETLQGFLVPPRRLVTVDLTELVPVRRRITTMITARSGRLVADRIQTLTGTDGTVVLDVSAGAPAAATSWYFADGRVDPGTHERIAIFNPGEETAEVEVSVDRSRVAQQLPIEPFELQIGPQSYAEIVLNDEGRVPEPLRHSTVVRSVNGVAVVAERVQLSGTVIEAATGTDDEDGASGGARAGADGTDDVADGEPGGAPAGADQPAGLAALPPGLSASLGSPVVATEWVLPMAAQGDTPQAKVVVTNAVMDQPVRMEITAWVAGREVAVDLPEQTATLEARQQAEIPVAVPGGTPAMLVIVRASGPVVVDGVWVFGPAADTAIALAVPTAPGVSVPEPLGVVGLPTTTVGPTTTRSGTVASTVTTSVPAGVTTTSSTTVPTTAPTTAPTTTSPPTTMPVTVPPETAPPTPPPTAAPGA